MNKKMIGLGTFLKEVEKRINGLSKEEIKAILLMKARGMKPTERESFLAELNPRRKALERLMTSDISDLLILT